MVSPLSLHLFAGAAPRASPLAAMLALRARGRRSVPRALRAPAGRAIAIALLALLAVGGCGDRAAPHEARGTLLLTVRDAATGEPTPARMELLDESGRAVVPDDALAVFSDCGRVPIHNWVPGFATLQAWWNEHRAIANPYTGTTQFYADGSVRVELPAGRYAVQATKGIEFRRASETVVVESGRLTRLDLGLERWIDLAAEGWFGADDHLHIPRPHPRFDPRLATWMEAEGLQVANLLQMGLARDLHITPQHGFGPASAFQRGDTLILSGQENPRTHVLGHAIVLGARRFLDLPQHYLLYDRVWREAHRQRAVNGYAHWGLAGAEEGLALWGPEALLDFVEVLNLGFPFYDRWYEALDLGFRIGPTAGTDYPCLPGLPGRERFYARLDGPLEPRGWLEAVRRGRTFVTNGPAIELRVEGALPGDELSLAAPGAIRIRGRVRFDPRRDAVTTLELVRGGEPIERVDAAPAADEIRLESTLEIDRTSWLALRAAGAKRDETEIDLRPMFSGMLVLERRSNEPLLDSLPEGPVARPSVAHTGAILVTVAGTPPLSEQPRAQQVARLWLARLDELERRLEDDRMRTWAEFPGRGDGIDLRTALANRNELLRAIQGARRHYAAHRP